ncbi:response regulator, partial [bacterium]|nr:response regulator [bacterium]
QTSVEEIFDIEFPLKKEFNYLKYNGSKVFFIVRKFTFYQNFSLVILLDNTESNQLLLGNAFIKSISHRFNNKISNILGWVEHLKITMKNNIPDEIIKELEDSCFDMINFFNQSVDLNQPKIKDNILVSSNNENANTLNMDDRIDILLLEDEQLLKKILLQTFEIKNLSCHDLSSYEEFISLKKKDIYSCAIIDVGISAEKGFCIAKELQAVSPDISIIFVSGNNYQVEVEEAKNCIFIKKPFRLEQLLSVIESYIE